MKRSKSASSNSDAMLPVSRGCIIRVSSIWMLHHDVHIFLFILHTFTYVTTSTGRRCAELQSSDYRWHLGPALRLQRQECHPLLLSRRHDLGLHRRSVQLPRR